MLKRLATQVTAPRLGAWSVLGKQLALGAFWGPLQCQAESEPLAPSEAALAPGALGGLWGMWGLGGLGGLGGGWWAVALSVAFGAVLALALLMLLNRGGLLRAFMSRGGAVGQRRAIYTAPRESLGAHFFRRKPPSALTMTVPFLTPYNPKNVGNDASARPWESPERERILGSILAMEVSTGAATQDARLWGAQGVRPAWGAPSESSAMGTPLESANWAHQDLPQAWREGLTLEPQTWSRFDPISAAYVHPPPGSSSADFSPHWPFEFEVADFLKMAQKHFLSLQEAWDRRDLVQMKHFLSPAMLQDVQDQLAQMAPEQPTLGEQAPSPVLSEVLMLESQCLSVKREGQEQKVSVELSGMIREGLSASPNPFREIWTWSKTMLPQQPNDLQGWRVCALEALQ